jgi:hypothetical protein
MVSVLRALCRNSGVSGVYEMERGDVHLPMYSQSAGV